MTRYIKFQWKKDFQNIPWYIENPAHKYLSDEAKLDLLEEYILEEDYLDSEAEFVIIEYNNTN